MIQKISLGLEVVGTGNIDREAVVDEREQLPLHHRQEIRSAPQLIRRAPVEKPLIDVNQLVPTSVLERELVAEAEQLPLDEEGIAFVLVLDRETICQRQQLLLHHIAH